MEYFDEINKLKYIHLENILEPKSYELIINITEVVSNYENEALRKKYSVCFDHYASYCVNNETYTDLKSGDNEEWVGQMICIFSKSNYLDYVSKDTRAEGYYDFEKKLKHYGIYCLDHTIHIASFDEPIIKKINN